ncbi:MAG TPA: hypothetical protein VLS89_15205 [Candidatus Nanopelagicales bacterium]|nr:hypothetical protein [Candidatus Nanopelagicales bacterium]
MSGDEPRLLLREQGELDAIAARLRGGRRVVVFCVCAPALRPAVLGRLRDRSGVRLPDPTAPGSPDEMLARLKTLSQVQPGVVESFALDAREVDVLRTLNWHREKLRRGGSSILWLEDIEALRALRAWGPDAYSFRDFLVLIRGEPRVTLQRPTDEDSEILLARLHLLSARTAEGRAAAALRLGGLLWGRGEIEEICRLLEGALAEVVPDIHESVELRLIRIGLLRHLALAEESRGRLVRAWAWAERGLAEIGDTEWYEERLLRLDLLATKPSPLGLDHHAIPELLAALSVLSEQEERHGHFTASIAESARLRGDLRRAATLISNVLEKPRLRVGHRALATANSARIAHDRGELSAAEAQWRAASSLHAEANQGSAFVSLGLANCFRLRGELQAARRMLEEVVAYPGKERPLRLAAGGELAEISLDEGRTREALAALHAIIMEAARHEQDEYVYIDSDNLVEAVRHAYEAARLSLTDLHEAEATLATAEDVALSIASVDPPWYPILFPALRAELLALQPDHLDEAISLLTASLERARAVWTDAAPMHARKLVRVLLRAGRLDDVRAALAVAIPEAESQRHLKELAILQAAEVALLARTSAAPADIDAALDRLRATFDASGGRRLTAETLLDLALALPPEAARPDPLALLDEAHDLFLDMPMPAQEARCLEAMGDVLAARGKAPEARRRYLMAKGIYEQYGLGLRLPLLTSRLDRLPEASPPEPPDPGEGAER